MEQVFEILNSSDRYGSSSVVGVYDRLRSLGPPPGFEPGAMPVIPSGRPLKEILLRTMASVKPLRGWKGDMTSTTDLLASLQNPEDLAALACSEGVAETLSVAPAGRVNASTKVGYEKFASSEKSKNCAADTFAEQLRTGIEQSQAGGLLQIREGKEGGTVGALDSSHSGSVVSTISAAASGGDHGGLMEGDYTVIGFFKRQADFYETMYGFDEYTNTWTFEQTKKTADQMESLRVAALAMFYISVVLGVVGMVMFKVGKPFPPATMSCFYPSPDPFTGCWPLPIPILTYNPPIGSAEDKGPGTADYGAEEKKKQGTRNENGRTDGYVRIRVLLESRNNLRRGVCNRNCYGSGVYGPWVWSLLRLFY
jgi:hypothetical protein